MYQFLSDLQILTHSLLKKKKEKRQNGLLIEYYFLQKKISLKQDQKKSQYI